MHHMVVPSHALQCGALFRGAMPRLLVTTRKELLSFDTRDILVVIILVTVIVSSIPPIHVSNLA